MHVLEYIRTQRAHPLARIHIHRKFSVAEKSLIGNCLAKYCPFPHLCAPSTCYMDTLLHANTLNEERIKKRPSNIVQICCCWNVEIDTDFQMNTHLYRGTQSIHTHERREKDRRRRPLPPPPPPLLKLNYKSSLQIHTVAGRQTHIRTLESRLSLLCLLFIRVMYTYKHKHIYWLA